MAVNEQLKAMPKYMYEYVVSRGELSRFPPPLHQRSSMLITRRWSVDALYIGRICDVEERSAWSFPHNFSGENFSTVDLGDWVKNISEGLNDAALAMQDLQKEAMWGNVLGPELFGMRGYLHTDQDLARFEAMDGYCRQLDDVMYNIYVEAGRKIKGL